MQQAIALCLGFLCASVGAAPQLADTSWPEPPQQKTLWTPPATSLPEVVVSAARVLHEQGLADPRGCEYREVELVVGHVRVLGRLAKTHAWVIPAETGQTQQFVVAWSGLVYPAASIGGKADVESDVRALVKTAEAKADRRFREMAGYAIREDAFVAPDTMLLTKAVLLLRLGKNDLARAVWAMAENQAGPSRDPDQPKDPYLSLASDWAWALFDRAVCAHMRGDDPLALASARLLARILPLIDAEAAKRGFIWRERADSGSAPAKKTYLTFLDPLPRLLADQERRAKRGVHRSILETGLDKLPDPTQRIAALIDSLDEVSARQMGQPGGVALDFDPLVAELVRHGNAAVEPLIACLESDARMTRSVGFHRDFFRNRTVVSVRTAARVALERILQTEFPGGAADARSFWEKFKGLSSEERLYRVLQDDQAGPVKWLEAAKTIVQADNVTGAPWVGHFMEAPLPPGQRPGLRGESLRARRNPSISDLLAKRVTGMAKDAARLDQSMGVDAVRGACELTLALATWEKSAAVNPARLLVQRAIELFDDERSFIMSSGEHLGWDIARLTLVRMRGADHAAPDDYVKWLHRAEPKKLGSYLAVDLEPLWSYPDHQAFVELVGWMFNDPASPWYKLPAGSSGRDELVASPLIGTSGFRRMLLRDLTNRSPVGTVTLRGGGSLDANLDEGGGTSMGVAYRESEAPPAGTEVRFRHCDWRAWQLAGVEGTPKFQLFWPEQKRDEGVQAMAGFLEKYGERFKHVAQETARETWTTPVARMNFPLLGRPATGADVRAAQAIFSLESQGQTRVVELPHAPLRARWVAQTNYAVTTKAVDENGSSRPVEIPLQDGQVWQAEELVRDGRVQRFYGFVGRHDLARVPADEIEFVADDEGNWAALSRGIDSRVSIAASNLTFHPLGLPEARTAAPVPISVWLHNRSGLEQNVPNAYCRTSPPPALAVGIRLVLAQLDESEVQQVLRGNLRGDLRRGKWSELKPKLDRHFPTPGEVRRLGLTEAFEAFRLDLKDWFDLPRRGLYRIEVTFSEKDGCFAEGRTSQTFFLLR